MNQTKKDLLDKFVSYNCPYCNNILIKESKENWRTFDIESGEKTFFGVYGCKKCGSYFSGKVLYECK